MVITEDLPPDWLSQFNDVERDQILRFHISKVAHSLFITCVCSLRLTFQHHIISFAMKLNAALKRGTHIYDDNLRHQAFERIAGKLQSEPK